MNDILMQMPGKLVFTAEGRWTHDGEEVTHENIRDYFSAHLKFSTEHQSYVIAVDGRCVQVEVEDTAVVVRTFETSTWPWKAKLSWGGTEDFRPETLEVNPDGIFYCQVGEDFVRARLLRPAWQALLPYLEEGPNRKYFLMVGPNRYVLRTAEN